MIKTKHFATFLFYICFILAVGLLSTQSLQAIIEGYTISGTVATTTGRGIDGVQVEFNDGEQPQYVWTSGGGYYSYTVFAGWQGTVTPSHDCYAFSPTQADVGPVNANIVRNFTATIHTYTISGVISDGPPVYAGETLLNPIPDVLLTLSTGGSTTTGPDGSYSFTVTCGWGGTVTPLKVGWEFNPQQRYYEWVGEDYTGEDYVGTASTTEYTISGQVSDAGGRTGMDGVTIEFFDGVAVHNETTAGGGFYSYSVPAYWTGTVTPSLDGYSFSPTFATVGPVQANVTRDFSASANTYTISGTVMDLQANPIAGVTMTLSTIGTTVTNSSGYYAFEVVHGWSGNLVPSRTGWSFKPTYRSYSNVMSNHSHDNFIGKETKDQFTISGTVTAGGAALANVVMNGLPGNPKTGASGFYSAAVTQGWSGTATPTLSGYIFDPFSRTYADVQDNYVNQNYEALVNDPPQVEIVSPPDGAFVKGEVIIKAEASDSDGIGKIEFYIDGQKVAEYLNIQSQAAAADPHDLARVLAGNLPFLQRDSQGNSYSLVSGKDGKMALIKHGTPHQEILLEEDMPVLGWLVKPGGTVILAGTTPTTGESWIKSLTPWLDIKWSLGYSQGPDIEIDFADLLLNPANTGFTAKYLWDTSFYSLGTHHIMARAYDAEDQSATDEIELIISSLTLDLQLERFQDTAWIISKEYVKIEAVVENPESIPISKYVIYRKAPGGEFLAIGEVPGSEVQGSTVTYTDQDVEKNKTYTYKVAALAENGSVIAASPEKTI
jgi:hypothetical protein